MDNKKSHKELFDEIRELTENKEIRVVGADALDMSQYSILGDEIYNLDYISRIDVSTPSNNYHSEFMKRYRENYRQTSKSIMSSNLMYAYIDSVIDHRSKSSEPFMSYEEYVKSLSGYVKESMDKLVKGIKHIVDDYNKSLPVQNKFIYTVNDIYLVIYKGRLSILNIKPFINPDSIYYHRGLYSPIMYIDDFGYITMDQYVKWLNLQNLKLLRLKIKVKRIKKR